MRLSGTYFERFFICVLPWTLFASLVMYLISDTNDSKVTLGLFLLFTSVFWIMDTLILLIKFKNPKKLFHRNGLWYGKNQISIEDIVSVCYINDQRYRWSFHAIEFTLANGEVFYTINKPHSLLYELQNKPPKTLALLFDHYPELEKKRVFKK